MKKKHGNETNHVIDNEVKCNVCKQLFLLNYSIHMKYHNNFRYNRYMS